MSRSSTGQVVERRGTRGTVYALRFRAYGSRRYVTTTASTREGAEDELQNVLADVRRGQYEGLRAEISQHGREPDFGRPRMHPHAGAVAVGARPFLIAWNVNLDTDDVELAKRLARRVRESGGGLPGVQGNGFRVEEPERGHPVRAQVSMNLLDFEVTSLRTVFDRVQELAAQKGVQVAESELVGLAPAAAIDAALARHIKLPRFDAREQVVEAKLAALGG